LDKDKRSGSKGSAFSKRQARQSAPEGLEIEAGFEIWLAFLRDHFGDSYAWDRDFATALERVDVIDKETSLLLEVAPQWSAEKFYAACTIADPDITKGSEHYVTRYFEGASPRVVKATIPGKYGRPEYSPSIYLNSWRLFQEFVPALNIRVHGILVQPVGSQKKPLPSIVTSMQYIEGGHPRAMQIRNYMEQRGWTEHTDESQTQDYVHKASRQIIRDAHPGNWIKRRGTAELIPVDISIEQFR
jgi:hypothetical protein